MNSASRYTVVLVTAPDRKTGRHLAGQLLRNHLAACVNLVPQIESHYWWRGKLESGREVLLVIKTSRAKLPALEECIRRHHPYDTPECIALPLRSGSQPYLDWIGSSLAPPKRPARKNVA